jgi:hypothetical protein
MTDRTGAPECPYCSDLDGNATGWITIVAGGFDEAYEVPCPNGCPMPELPPVRDEEVPS